MQVRMNRYVTFLFQQCVLPGFAPVLLVLLVHHHRHHRVWFRFFYSGTWLVNAAVLQEWLLDKIYNIVKKADDREP